MKQVTVQSFLQESFSKYRESHALPLYQVKVAEQLMKCRTAALGGHALYCEDGHLNGVWYNSCKHRSCPQCSGLKAAQWQHKAESLLLQSQHHHWVFTLPHDLHIIWRLNRLQLSEFMQIQSKCRVVMEACYSSHYWGRTFEDMGHTVDLIPAQHVTPFVRGNKNDSNDTLAIFEASTRPFIRFVPVKTIAQQEVLILHRLRERLLSSRIVRILMRSITHSHSCRSLLLATLR